MECLWVGNCEPGTQAAEMNKNGFHCLVADIDTDRQLQQSWGNALTDVL